MPRPPHYEIRYPSHCHRKVVSRRVGLLESVSILSHEERRREGGGRGGVSVRRRRGRSKRSWEEREEVKKRGRLNIFTSNRKISQSQTHLTVCICK